MFVSRYWYQNVVQYALRAQLLTRLARKSGWHRKAQNFRPCCPNVLWALAGGFFTLQQEQIGGEELTKDEKQLFDSGTSAFTKNGWELLYEDKEKNINVYRRQIRVDGQEVYEYRVAGTFVDITPRNYIDAQNDVTYRSEWDQNVLKLEVMEDSGNKQGVPTSSGKNVRVSTYSSHCAVRAHTSVDEKGLDYVLTYFDNPEANIPRYVYNWIVNQGGPYFVHAAAKKLETTNRKLQSVFPPTLQKKSEPLKLAPSPAKCPVNCPVHCPKTAESASTEENEKTAGDAIPVRVAQTKKQPEAAATKINTPSNKSDETADDCPAPKEDLPGRKLLDTIANPTIAKGKTTAADTQGTDEPCPDLASRTVD
ncbi:unnamed protein product, partial [Mesorhabditis spiculigera]